ncbi:TetR/AcrR family transcriptional regulator [Phenylobacterium sp.]|jgi:TetR/AcrR family transcriptional repressor of mexJK operon|uniref:TetR/AcrR family transcriptional regulator n=1 Tax=Phenylobacterium sp. TaxID=1871053 RepID=UPI0040375167
MPRIVGQIDQAKSLAILDAAAEVLGTGGLSAPMDEIARRAGVSKQTIYNHYGSKAELIRAIVDRRVEEIAAPLLAPGAQDHPQEALAGFGRVMLELVLRPLGRSMLKMTVQAADDMPDLARAFYEAGPRTSRRRLADFLRQETLAGRLAVDDPDQAADFFAGMVIGVRQIAGLLGVEQAAEPEVIERVAQEAARRFMRAYGID